MSDTPYTEYSIYVSYITGFFIAILGATTFTEMSRQMLVP